MMSRNSGLNEAELIVGYANRCDSAISATG